MTEFMDNAQYMATDRMGSATAIGGQARTSFMDNLDQSLSMIYDNLTKSAAKLSDNGFFDSGNDGSAKLPQPPIENRNNKINEKLIQLKLLSAQISRQLDGVM
jgi:hypothetical protein